eukprot:scaffold550_cov220-Chaetoceros_neogracile.AAC.3
MIVYSPVEDNKKSCCLAEDHCMHDEVISTLGCMNRMEQAFTVRLFLQSVEVKGHSSPNKVTNQLTKILTNNRSRITLASR